MEDKKFPVWKAFWQIFSGYWNSEKKWEARGLLAVVIGLNFAMVYLLVRFNTWQNEFFAMFETGDYGLFWYRLGEFSLIAFLFIFIAANALYLQEMLRLRWRVWLTGRYLEKWMGSQSYYRLQVLGGETDNPDQRISEDVGNFARHTLGLMIGFLNKATSLVAFSVILWDLSGTLSFRIGGTTFHIYGYMFWACLAYSVIGTYFAHVVGRKTIGIKYDQQKYEANFRFSMMRVRENCESIAFYGGEQMELAGFDQDFGKCVKNYLKLMRQHRLLSLYTNTYSQAGAIMPMLMAAPRMFNGSMQIGQFMQLTHAFGMVNDAMSFFVNSYTTIASLAAVIRRLGLFTVRIDEVNAISDGVRMRAGEDGHFSTIGLNVQLPGGRTVMKDCTITLRRGGRVLVTGPSGCGKSTFLRTISGIWPFGSGDVAVSPKDTALFLPQRPYLPLGTLRRAVWYPLDAAGSDEQVIEALRLVQLEKLIGRLDDVDEWSRVLSLGEQQRVAFARVLLVRPDWVFLDESTSALDEKRETDMYGLLRRELPDMGVVSVGHRSSLFLLHDSELHMDGTSWVQRDIPAPGAA